jgi:hypothetical protein
VSFFRRLALFIVILVAMILFFGLFPVVAQGMIDINSPQNMSFKLHQIQGLRENVYFGLFLP